MYNDVVSWLLEQQKSVISKALEALELEGEEYHFIPDPARPGLHLHAGFPFPNMFLKEKVSHNEDGNWTTPKGNVYRMNLWVTTLKEAEDELEDTQAEVIKAVGPYKLWKETEVEDVDEMVMPITEPSSALASMAQKAGKDYADAERYWKDAKKQRAHSTEKSEGEFSSEDYQYIMGVVKKRLGLA